MVARLVLGLLLVALATDLGRCGEKEEFMQVAKEIIGAIERQDPEGILKYIHETVCFDIYCAPPDRVRQLLSDVTSVPSDMLLSGEYSLHDYLTEKTEISIQKNPDAKEPDSWQIRLNDPELRPISPAYIFVSKHPAGWTITLVRY